MVSYIDSPDDRDTDCNIICISIHTRTKRAIHHGVFFRQQTSQCWIREMYSELNEESKKDILNCLADSDTERLFG